MAQKRDIDKLAKEITAKYMAENGSDARGADQAASLERARARKSQMRNKAVLLAVVGCVITACLFYIGVAWYTRISNIHAVTFDVAEYELAINDNTDDDFLVNVYDYSNVKEKKAAPGTAGYIPLKISARHSEISVDYSIGWGNLMLEDLQKHIRFFYLEKDGKPVVCDLQSDGKTLTDATKDYFMAVPTAGNTGPKGTTKKYLTKEDVIRGTVTMNSEKIVYIYWEWYLDAEDAKAKGALESVTVDEAYKTAWDALDTDIGRYPKKYYDAMFVKLSCTGVQSVPVLSTRKK